jgi:hypothetical protein
MGFELRPSSTANSHFRKTKVSGDGIIGGGVRAGPFLCLLRADRGDMLSGWTQPQSSLFLVLMPLVFVTGSND